MSLLYRFFTFAEAEGRKKEFQKKSANLLRCRAPGIHTGVKHIQLCFYRSCSKRFQLLTQLTLPPSYSVTKPNAPTLQVGAEKFRSLKK